MTFDEWWGVDRDRTLAYDLMKVLTEAARQAWDAATEAAQPKWQPIATAPLIGKILVYTKGGRRSVAYWCSDEWNRRPKPYWQMQCHFNISQSRLDQPTLWMPLPEPPWRWSESPF